jgi:adenylate cyclase
MRSRSPPLTLIRLFVVTTIAIAVAVGATFSAFLESSRKSIVERSNVLRDTEARRIDERVRSELGVAAAALGDVERAVHYGVMRWDDPPAMEARLFSELLDHPTLSDITFTHATKISDLPDGEAALAPNDRWQISVFRATADPGSEITTRRTSLADGRFVTDVRRRTRGAGLLAAPWSSGPTAPDPTTHPTFATTASRRFHGRAIWSDLSFSELDSAMPEAERRIVVTVQKAVEDADDRFAGVLRVGLGAHTIDAVPRLAGADASVQIVLCDPQGRLVARLDPDDRVQLGGDDLRVVPAHPPRVIATALTPPLRSGPFDVGGTRYLATFRPLANTQDWVVGVVVPEDHYTHDLNALRDRFLPVFGAVNGIVLVAGIFVLGQLRRSLGRVVAATARMRRFDFSVSSASAPLREVADVLDGVERAKTSMRALGKYVPIDLVRQLYEANVEPRLGGEASEISLMFTDIEGFTRFSEKLAPDELARALGLYLEVMTRAIASTGGTVDKFIGDAVMAFWNAPTPTADHAQRACRAVLACRRATRDLYASEAWRGLPSLFTRFGLHRARVMVGHFGAPERFSYTALGDGVNLAARLEPLCKQYGVATLLSEAIVGPCRDVFAFRLIDKVAVKGKSEWVRVYELLGGLDECDEELTLARAYETALEAYFARDFAGARDLLRSHTDDPPSRVLTARCEAMIANPPPVDWNGVFVATSK